MYVLRRHFIIKTVPNSRKTITNPKHIHSDQRFIEGLCFFLVELLH